MRTDLSCTVFLSDPQDYDGGELVVQEPSGGERIKLAAGDAKGALALFEKLEGFPKTLLADARLAAGEPAKAVEILAAEHKEHPNQAAVMLRLFLAYDAVPQDEATKAAKHKLMEEALTALDLEALAASPLYQRMGGIGVDVRGLKAPPTETDGCGDDFGPRPPLASLGPAHWQPWSAPFSPPVSSIFLSWSMAMSRPRLRPSSMPCGPMRWTTASPVTSRPNPLMRSCWRSLEWLLSLISACVSERHLVRQWRRD